jgi:hypothetical protein
MIERIRRGAVGLLAGLFVWLAGPAPAHAQYFGQNKVQRDKFDFKVLETQHFDIYYYPEEAEAAKLVARMAERWRARLGQVLNHELTGRQPLILYASHPEFEQTNVIEGFIGEGTGGVTEFAKRRIVLPLAATLADTDHVVGHELVHAFQYDILGRNAGYVPLWFIEGMAEYLSIGPRSPLTAMWLRDAALHDRLPTLKQLSSPEYFPYRFGHAFWAYVAGRWGDGSIGQILAAAGGMTGEGMSTLDAIELATGMDRDALSQAWHQSVRETYDVTPGSRPEPTNTRRVVIGERTGSGNINVGPSLSPDGRRVAFLSERGRLSIDLYLADATTGKVIEKLTSTAADPHFESLQFLQSAGAWHPQGTQLAVATVRAGRPALALFNAESGDVDREIRFPELGEIFQPTWSPDGRLIAFTGQVGGVTDLFVHDIAAATTRRLTNDPFADLQPVWSPDGSRLAFVTERFSTKLESLAIGPLQLATITVAEGNVTAIETGMSGGVINPQWSPDGRQLYFVSNAIGRPNAYRLDVAGGQAVPVTSAITGVAGFTATSPALSIASRSGDAALSIFREGGFEIHVVAAEGAALAEMGEPSGVDLAMLPPPKRTQSAVAQFLQQPAMGLPPPQQTAQEREYEAGLSLVGIGTGAGVSTGQFGTFASGGIALQFSDMLGNHLLGVSFNINGGVEDVGASVTYLNRSRRWNWGIYGERLPLLNGNFSQGFTTIPNGQTAFFQALELQRQTFTQTGAVIAYPFSRTFRIEGGAGIRHIAFDNQVDIAYYDPLTGAFLGEETLDLPSESSLTLGDVNAALVRDTTVFGATSPILGQRFRFDVNPTFGTLNLTNLTTDLRQYLMPFRPVTFAGRMLHYGRYGRDGEDLRLYPLYLGYPSLVRGYDVITFDVGDCTVSLTSTCLEYDRLLGSRILVLNGEIRIPAAGLFTGNLDYGPVPVELFVFGDAGVAWTLDDNPTFANGTRDWVRSVGFGARVNMFGFAIGEFNAVRAVDRPAKRWQFVFNFRPGF